MRPTNSPSRPTPRRPGPRRRRIPGTPAGARVPTPGRRTSPPEEDGARAAPEQGAEPTRTVTVRRHRGGRAPCRPRGRRRKLAGTGAGRPWRRRWQPTDPGRAERLIADAERVAQSVPDAAGGRSAWPLSRGRWRPPNPTGLNALRSRSPARPRRYRRWPRSRRHWRSPNPTGPGGSSRRLNASPSRFLRRAGHRRWRLSREALVVIDSDRAERVARSIAETTLTAGVLTALARAVAPADPDRAGRLVADAERIAQSISGASSGHRRWPPWPGHWRPPIQAALAGLSTTPNTSLSRSPTRTERRRRWPPSQRAWRPSTLSTPNESLSQLPSPAPEQSRWPPSRRRWQLPVPVAPPSRLLTRVPRASRIAQYSAHLIGLKLRRDSPTECRVHGYWPHKCLTRPARRVDIAGTQPSGCSIRQLPYMATQRRRGLKEH